MRNAATEKLLGITSSTGMSIGEDAFATYMDEQDPLKEHRQSFHFPKKRDGTNFAYLVGHSLGLQHVGVEAAVGSFLRKWQDQACEGHFMQPNPWFEIDASLRKEMGAIVGATASEVVVMNSLTVNIHFMMAAFYKPDGVKKKIMMENQGFPSDTHCLISQLEAHGLNAEEDLVTFSAAGHEDWRSPPAPVPTETVLAAIERSGDETAILVLGAVHFLTGQLFDIPTIVKAAHAKNIIVGLDCAHAVANVPLKLHDWDVDFACWCTYKYLNSGPGNIGAAFVHSKHLLPGAEQHTLKGWWGHERKTRFSMHRNFEPEEGAAAFQCSTAPALSITALTPSVKLIASIGMDALREKSLQLTAYMELLLNELVPQGCIEIITPVDPAQRGAQLSIRVLPNKLKSDTTEAEGYECGTTDSDGTCDANIMQRQLLEDGIMVDNRPPDVLRLAPVPLYNSYTDVLECVRAIAGLF